MTIGVLSDTHGHLDTRIAGIFAGVRHIFHAGDVGDMAVLTELECIAPVTAVAGNTDGDLSLRPCERIELGGKHFLLRHIVNPAHPDAALRHDLLLRHPDAVVFGHTHAPFQETIGNILFLNPGCARKPRAPHPCSVALLHCEAGGMRVEFRRL